jgi:hypothetical protein
VEVHQLRDAPERHGFQLRSITRDVMLTVTIEARHAPIERRDDLAQIRDDRVVCTGLHSSDFERTCFRRKAQASAA